MAPRSRAVAKKRDGTNSVGFLVVRFLCRNGHNRQNVNGVVAKSRQNATFGSHQ